MARARGSEHARKSTTWARAEASWDAARRHAAWLRAESRRTGRQEPARAADELMAEVHQAIEAVIRRRFQGPR